jgi:hypothetical protein
MLVSAMALALGVIPVSAQSLDDLNIQIHGYATQGFLYTTQNNIFSAQSSDGSPAWTEAVVNVTAQPTPKLRVGVQARYFLLGNYGNAITLDWASGDYKFNEKFGVRFGKVKTPEGLFNLIQDVDPSYIWSLLPQGIYPIATRTSILTLNGGVVYGKLRLSEAGSLDYYAWDGERVVAGSDPLLSSFTSAGILFPSGMSGNIYGATLRWHTPIHGLMLGASETENHQAGATTLGSFTGWGSAKAFQIPFYFGHYEHNRVSFDYEYMRLPLSYTFVYKNGPTIGPIQLDFRTWYGMGTYKVSDKLTAGAYFSSCFNRQEALGTARYQKDWTVSARYDLSQYVYLKAEQHFIDGTGGIADAYSTTDNATLKPTTKLTILKVGVRFSAARTERVEMRKLLFYVFVLTAVVSTCARAQMVIANDSVKSASVSKSELRDVFTGASASLGGSHVVPALLKSGPAHEAFLAEYVGKSDAALSATWRSLVFSGQASMPKSVDSDAAMVEYVVKTPGAIGYIAKTSPHEGVKVLAVQ